MIATILLIGITCFLTWKGLKNEQFFEGYIFDAGRVLQNKDYLRLVSSGFLHINWLHLAMNMVGLFIFGSALEAISIPEFLLIYFASMIGGNLFSLFIHRHHEDYTSVGASGAVNGLVFAYIALLPDTLFWFIPAWVYGIIYVLATIYGIRSKAQNIGHEAHLGGGIVGMLLAMLLHTEVIVAHWYATVPVLGICILFIWIVTRRPHLLLVQNIFYESHENLTIDDRYNIQRGVNKKEIDRILEKIHDRGMGSLSKQEKQSLDEYSKRN